MRSIFCAEEAAVVESVLATTVRKIVPAIVAIAAGNVSADNYTGHSLKWNALEIDIFTVATDGRDGANIFMALNQRKFEFALAVLSCEPLVGVFVRATDSGELHF